MSEAKQRIEDILRQEDGKDERKRLLLDCVYDAMKDEEHLNSEVLGAFKDSWSKLEAFESTSTTLKLENEYRQAIRNFTKNQERVERQKRGKQQKNSLLETAKELKETDDVRSIASQLYALKNEWEDAPYAGQDYDSQLNKEFRVICDEVFRTKEEYYDGIQSNMKQAKENKLALIERTKEAASSTNWKETSKEMREFMEEWKKAGNASREENDILWEQFQEARQSFFTKQEAYFEGLKERQAESLIIKKKLIEDANAICNDEDIKETSIKMKELMSLWKKAGTSGREFDDSLWEEFSKPREIFYARQSEFYEAKKGKFMDNLYDGIKRRNKQLADLDIIVKDLEERVQEIRSLEPVLGNQEDRWEITNQRNQEIAKYQEYLRDYYKKMEVVQNELKELNEKYEKLEGEE